eukprot:Hpha_TRINITY_DN16725_c4_g12::TRINITY_DN16725_c4_g12_i1::g.77490::m.77490
MALRFRGDKQDAPDLRACVERAAEARVAAEASDLGNQAEGHWLSDMAGTLSLFALGAWLFLSLLSLGQCAQAGCSQPEAIRSAADIPTRPLRVVLCAALPEEAAVVFVCGANVTLPLFLAAAVCTCWWNSIAD